MVSLETPHPPYDAPAAGVTPRDPASIILAPNVPRGGEIEARARRELAGYYAHLEATDRAVGRLLASIPPALVVFTSAHATCTAPRPLPQGLAQEESIRVPLIIQLPPGAPAQPRRSEQLVVAAEPAVLDLGLGRRRRAPRRSAALGRWWARSTRPSRRSPCPRSCASRTSATGPAGNPHARAQAGAQCRWHAWLFFDLDRDPLELRNQADDPARAGEISALRELRATARIPGRP